MEDIHFKDLCFLVIDDDQYYLNLTVKHLKSLGAKVITSKTNGKEAYDFLLLSEKNPKQHGKIDVILCDWVMPKITGLQLYKKLKKDSLLSDKRLFFMTTSVDAKESIINAIQAGVNGYIVKPFEKEQLEKQLTHSVEHFFKKKLISEGE